MAIGGMNVNRGSKYGAGYSVGNALSNIGNARVKDKKKRTIANILDFGGGLSQTMGWTNEEPEEYPQFIPYIMPQDTEAGASALPILQSRARGEGVAFSPEQLTMYGQPYAQAATNIWENYSKPSIEESYASRGLGRSTMAGQAEVQGQRELADLIGVNWSDLNKWNETLKQQGITGGVSGLMDYMGSELNQSNLNTSGMNDQSLGSFAYQNELDKQAYETNENQMGFIMNLIGKGAMAQGSNSSDDSSSYGAILQALQNNKQNSPAEKYYENQPRSVYTSGSGISNQANNLDYWRNKYKYGGY